MANCDCDMAGVYRSEEARKEATLDRDTFRVRGHKFEGDGATTKVTVNGYGGCSFSKFATKNLKTFYDH